MRTGVASAASAVGARYGARRHNENDVTVTIAGLWRYGNWRHVTTGCSTLLKRFHRVLIQVFQLFCRRTNTGENDTSACPTDQVMSSVGAIASYRIAVCGELSASNYSSNVADGSERRRNAARTHAVLSARAHCDRCCPVRRTRALRVAEIS